MPPGLDIVTNDAGENVRRAHARDLGEDVIVALHRLVRLTKLHDVENQAFSRQLEQTHRLVVDYCLHAGANLSVLFANRVVLIGGQILKGSRAAYEAAIDLGESLAWCGGSEMVIARGITARELKDFAESLGEALRSRRADAFRSPTDKVRLRQVSAAAKLRGVDIERLDLEQRVVRTYSSAVVVMRRFFADLQAGRYIMPAKIKRIAQGLVDLSEGQTPAFLGVTDVRNQNHDDAGRAVNTAILAVTTARQLSEDRALLSQIAMAALMHDVARPRALRAFAGDAGVPVATRLSEDAEDRLAAGAAAVLTALGRVNEPTVSRTVITYEALWMRRLSTLGPLYSGAGEPTLHARIVAIARRYNDLVTPEPGLAPPPADRAVARLSLEFNTPSDLTVLRMLVGALGVFPVGTVVTLSSGETAEVVPGRSPSAPYHLPRVRLIMDARGGLLAPAVEVDLAAPPAHMQGARIIHVLSTDGWSKGLQAPERQATHRPPQQSVDSERPPAPQARLSAPTNDDSLRSAVSHSSPRSLGWHDAAQARAASQSAAPLPSAPPSARLRPPPGVDDPWRPTGPVRSKSPAEPQLPKLHDGPQDEPTERTVFSPSTFEIEEGAADHDDVDDEAGTMYFRHEQRAPKMRSGPSLEIEPSIVPTAQGDLHRTPLVHVLVYLLDRELTGSLVVRDPEHREHCVFFSQGAPAKVRTEHPVALVGEELISERQLSPAALEASVAAAQQHNTLIGVYLVRYGLVTPPILEHALRAQVIHRLQWLAKLPGESTYAFYRDRNLLSAWGGEESPCEPLNAILAAMRAWNDHTRIITNLLRLKESPIRLHPEAQLDGLALTHEEAALAETIRTRGRTLVDLYGNNLAQDRGISAFLYMLLATRQLVVPGQQRAPMGSNQQGEDNGPLAPLSAPPTSSAWIAVPQRPSSPSPPSGMPEDNSDEDSDESYPSLPTSPSAVAHAVIADMQAAGISFRGQRDTAPSCSGAERDEAALAHSEPPLPTQGLEVTARGQLSTTPLIHVLTYMFDHGATGSVVLREPDRTEHCIYFDRGCPAKVRTGRPIARLGEMLVARNELPRSLLDEAVEAARGIDALVGEYLIIEGLASRASVMRTLDEQVREKIVALVNLPNEAFYSFFRIHNLLTGWAGNELFVTNPLAVIHAAARKWTDRRRMRGALHRIRDRELFLHPNAEISGLSLTDSEREVVDRIQMGGASLRTLHLDRITDEEVVNSIVYALAITRQFMFRNQRKPPMRPRLASTDRLTSLTADETSAYRDSTPNSEPPSWNSIRISVLPVSLPPGMPWPAEQARASRASEPARDPSPRTAPLSSSSGAARNSERTPSPNASARLPSTPPSSVRRSPGPRPPLPKPSREATSASAGEDASGLYHQALDALRKGNRAKAEQLARSAAELDPACGDYAALAAWAAASSAKKNAVRDAIGALSSVLRADPTCESARFYRAKLYRRAGQVAPALADLDELLKRNPEHREAAAEARLLRARHRPPP